MSVVGWENDIKQQGKSRPNQKPKQQQWMEHDLA